MKKSQMLSFLFWTILALVIFIPTGLWASQFFKLSNKSLDSYNQLLFEINSIKDGETSSVLLYMDPKSLIAGFSKNAEKVQSVVYDSTGTSPLKQTRGFMRKPSQCTSGKACVCLCNSASVEGEEIKCDDKIYCKSIENIDFFEKRFIEDLDFSVSPTYKPGRLWENGFIIANSNDNAIIKKVYTAIPSNYESGKRRQLYVQRHGIYVNVCFSPNCITDKIIDEFNKPDAIKEFMKLKEAVFQCKLKVNGICDPYSITLPERYYLYYQKSRSIALINTPNPDLGYITRHAREIIVKDENENDVALEENLYMDEEASIEYQTGIFSQFADLMVKEGKVIVEPTY